MAVYDVLPTTNLKVDDVADTLRANGGVIGVDENGMIKLSDLFSEGANINHWSARKPFASAEDFTETWKCGFTFDNTFTPKRMVYERPTGGSGSPYRLGDFRGYDAKVKPSLYPDSVNVEINDVDAQAGSQTLTVDIRNFKSLGKLLSADLGIDTFLFLGRPDTAKKMTLTGTSETVSQANAAMAVSSDNVYVKNPGVDNLTKYVGAFAKSADIVPNLAYNQYVFDEDTLAVKSRVRLASPTITNTANGATLVPGHIVKGQFDFALADPPIQGDYSVFYDAYIFLTWYRVENGYLTIYISGDVDMAYQDKLLGGVFVEEKKKQGYMRLRSYYGHMGEDGDVVRDGWFGTIDNANAGKCEVEYYESYEGTDTFGFDYNGIFLKSVYQNPLWVIKTPYKANELTPERNVVVTQIVPWN